MAGPNRSTTIPTPSGAWLGTTLTQLKTIYAGIPGEDLSQGPRKAYPATTDLRPLIVLFDLDSSNRVLAMVAGESSYLKSSFINGTDFCSPANLTKIAVPRRNAQYPLRSDGEQRSCCWLADEERVDAGVVAQRAVRAYREDLDAVPIAGLGRDGIAAGPAGTVR